MCEIIDFKSLNENAADFFIKRGYRIQLTLENEDFIPKVTPPKWELKLTNKESYSTFLFTGGTIEEALERAKNFLK